MKAETFYLRSEQDKNLPSSLLFNIVLKVLARAIRARIRNKSCPNRKGEVKLSMLFDMILYVENSKGSIKKLLSNEQKISYLMNTFMIFVR